MTQEEWVLKTLSRGSTVTPARAFLQFGILRLAAVVHSLKRKGHKIETIIERKKGKEFARYRKGK